MAGLLRRVFCVLAIPLSVTTTAGTADASALPSQLRVATITAGVKEHLRRTHAVGIAVAILHNGTLLYVGGFGARYLGGPPVNIHTRFEIGSDTKQFTAAAVLQLKERSKLSLDDPLAKFVPSFPHAREVTIRELLYQTSGLPEYMQTNHFLHTAQTSVGSLAKIERMAAGPLHFAPGSRWEYSNTNYIALGRVIEIASGETYGSYIRKHLFRPARMRETATIAQESNTTNMATGYWRGRTNTGPLERAPTIPASWTGSAGEIISTVGDIAKWDMALHGGRIINSADFALMTTPAKLSGGKRDDYGFGWWIDPLHGYKRIYHDGDTPGFSSSNNLFPEVSTDIIVLQNATNDAASRTAEKLFDLIIHFKATPRTLRSRTVPKDRFSPATIIHNQLGLPVGRWTADFVAGEQELPIRFARIGQIATLHVNAPKFYNDAAIILYLEPSPCPVASFERVPGSNSFTVTALRSGTCSLRVSDGGGPNGRLSEVIVP